MNSRTVSLGIGGVYAEGLQIDVVAPESPGARNLAGLDAWGRRRFELSVARASMRMAEASPTGTPRHPFIRQGTPHRFVPVDVAGARVAAVFDTGAGISIVDATLASKHPSWFANHSIAIGTDASGVQATTPTAMMMHTSVAGQAMAPHRVAFLDLASATAHLEHPVLMILGLPAIAEFDWWLDFVADEWGIVGGPD